jgi:hypothetical protein
MKPEDISADRPVRDIVAIGPAKIIYHEGKDAVLSMMNERGSFEVLATADRAAEFIEQALQPTYLKLTGFWRRRSGINAEGNRHFIWCLVLISWEDATPLQQAA